jgi:hypothetical protein
VASFRELTQMEAHSRNDASKILQERVQELLRPK